ncbi:MAG: DUF4145 domain-containing protein [Phycisphaerales bacterium]|nr:DUF4145 domain-containing protein [Phycisphaerales bacterium]
MASRNFGFMERYDQRVSRLADQAERYVYTDPESCLFKLRLMVETMARTLIELQAPQLVDSDLSTMLRALERSQLLSRKHADQMHAIRRDGNSAVHGDPTPSPTAMRRLHDAHRLSGWYCRTVKRGAKVELHAFEPPPRAKDSLKNKAQWAKGEALETSIEEQRRRTREALLLFGEDEDIDAIAGTLIEELRGWDDIAIAAGEPLIDAEFVALVMAMDIEKLLEHPRFGVPSQEAHAQAEAQFDLVRGELEAKEAAYRTQRRNLAQDQAEDA